MTVSIMFIVWINRVVKRKHLQQSLLSPSMVWTINEGRFWIHLRRLWWAFCSPTLFWIAFMPLKATLIGGWANAKQKVLRRIVLNNEKCVWNSLKPSICLFSSLVIAFHWNTAKPTSIEHKQQSEQHFEWPKRKNKI